MLVEAQESVGGVPRRFVEEKKEELRKKREEADKVVREARERAQKSGGGGFGREGRRKSRWDSGAPAQPQRRLRMTQRIGDHLPTRMLPQEGRGTTDSAAATTTAARHLPRPQ